MSYDLTGKRVVVTGASSGIGAALASAFAAAGATVSLCARRADRLRDVAVACGDGAWFRACDLAVASDVDAFASEVLDRGGVDVLVNNAGIPKRRHVTALDADTVDDVMRVNFLAPARLTLALLPSLLSPPGGDGARIVNVSSVAAVVSSPGAAAYDASQAALAVWSEAIAIDLWDRGVKVMVVYPGVFDTELFTLPGNDPYTGPLELQPVSVLVDAVLAGLAADAAQVFVPELFRDLAASKAADTAGFLAGTAEWVRSQSAPRSQPGG
jgi:NAD(P)-dependent dehydrogenase (short-subunit alcohol dehydrogenase family)